MQKCVSGEGFAALGCFTVTSGLKSGTVQILMTNTVLITGASQGIGKATALRFLREGYNVVLAARQPDRLEAVAEEVRALRQQALVLPTDVRDINQVTAMV